MGQNRQLNISNYHRSNVLKKKSHAMCCNGKFNMLNIFCPILEYLSYLLSDFQTVFSILMGIWRAFMLYETHYSPLSIPICHCCDENCRRMEEHSIVGSWLATLLRFLRRNLRWAAMLLEPSKSWQNGLFHRIVWPGLIAAYSPGHTLRCCTPAILCLESAVMA